MALIMETHISGNVVILHCTGRIVFGDEAAAFGERIKMILLGTNQIVVNLGGIEYINSGGLGWSACVNTKPARRDQTSAFDSARSGVASTDKTPYSVQVLRE